MVERGGFHDQGDAKWIVIRRKLRGHNDTPCRRPTPGRPIGQGWPPLVTLFLNIVPLIMEFTTACASPRVSVGVVAVGVFLVVGGRDDVDDFDSRLVNFFVQNLM
jgi:hypothetical protein